MGLDVNTPYAEHARNYLPEQPSHSPPVYAPESVAEAILHAAAHPTREFTVGSAGKLLSISAAVTPRVTDVLESRWILPHTYSGRPPRGRAALFEPTEDLELAGTIQVWSAGASPRPS